MSKIVGILGIVIIGALFLPTAMFAQEFELEVKQVQPDSMVGGSIPIEVTVTYIGKKPIEWAKFGGYSLTSSHVLRSFEFENIPAGWEDRWKNKLLDMTHNIEGMGPVTRTLCTGDKMHARLYLQDYFRKMTTGRHPLTIVYRPTGMKKQFYVELTPFDEGRFIEFVDSILEKIENKGLSYDERLNAFNEVYYLSHPSLSGIYLAILKDKSDFWSMYTVYRAFARNALEHEDCLEELVRYLPTVEDGNYANAVFEEWERAKATLPNELLSTLRNSENNKVREYATAYAEHMKKYPSPKWPSREPRHAEPNKVKEATNWILPALIIIGVVIAGVVLFFLLRRRQAQ
jgi:hypothetical protein